MSRLIIKNLPSYVTPVRLKEHFEQKTGPGGTITDFKVALKSDGTSRRFGFIGFKTDQEAEAAKKWFNRTFIDTTRIDVSLVQGAQDAPAPRPNKRPRLGPSPVEKPEITAIVEPAVDPTKKKGKSAAQMDEYMALMNPRTKGPAWANDQQRPASPPAPEQPGKEGLSADTPIDVPMDVEAEGVSDLDWMKRRMTAAVDEVVPEKVFEQDDEGDASSVNKLVVSVVVAPKSKESETETTILQTSRLYVVNVPFTCTSEELSAHFASLGELSQVHLPLDSATKKPKGTAYVSFVKPEDAVSAYKSLHKRPFQGRMLDISAAVDRRGASGKDDAEARAKTVKQEKNAKLKASAGKQFNWAMLYMNSDAVVSSVADRMNISKADILNPESDNAAVKLALAETHVIQETKVYLEKHGVLLSSFESKARSQTTILVKNIPYGTTAEQIRELFEPHGSLARVLVPPAGTMAVVDFDDATEASVAFGKVSYKRLGSSIIYLEKGPAAMFTGAPFVEDEDDEPEAPSVVKPITIAEQRGVNGAEQPAIAEGTTLYIKNLAFATTPERLEQVFSGLPAFSYVRIPTKADPKRPASAGAEAGKLSMGYGFVGFKTVDGAKQAMKSMQGFALDGHALHVSFAGRGADDSAVPKGTTTKMLVKNVPFEASQKDIRELFGAHGQLKSVRLPKKFGARSRGFAFLEFVSRHEAENAYSALRHTHLLGRHLVLEWAEEGEHDIEKLRQKAGVGLGGGGEMGKKRKLNFGGEGDAGDDGTGFD